MSQRYKKAVNAAQMDRPKRQKKLTQKAEEIADAGRSVLGLPSTDTPSSSQLTDSISTPGTPHSSPEMPSTSRAPTMGPNSKDAVQNDDDQISYDMPSFRPLEFAIYFWEYPRPPNFLALSKSRMVWKRAVDLREQAEDIDDGSDDWDEFCSDVVEIEYAVEYTVARTFVKRAKRAFWAGKTWLDFQFQELTTNSEDAARREVNPERRQLMLELALDNQLRLAVFDALKHRLCEEIWLEAYEEPAGLVKLSMPGSRKDSKMWNSSGAAVATDEAQLTPTADEWRDGVRGWSRDQLGVLQPLYQGETALPNGMSDFMGGIHDEEARGDVRGRSDGRVGNIGVHGTLRMSAPHEIAVRDLDLETSEEDEA